MEPSNTLQRTPPPSYRPVPSSPGSTSMFYVLNARNNETERLKKEEARIKAGPPKLTKRKFNNNV